MAHLLAQLSQPTPPPPSPLTYRYLAKYSTSTDRFPRLPTYSILNSRQERESPTTPTTPSFFLPYLGNWKLELVRYPSPSTSTSRPSLPPPTKKIKSNQSITTIPNSTPAYATSSMSSLGPLHWGSSSPGPLRFYFMLATHFTSYLPTYSLFTYSYLRTAYLRRRYIHTLLLA